MIASPGARRAAAVVAAVALVALGAIAVVQGSRRDPSSLPGPSRRVDPAPSPPTTRAAAPGGLPGSSGASREPSSSSSPVPVPAPVPAGHAALEGDVRLGGEPASGARVRVASRGDGSGVGAPFAVEMRTDASGRFRAVGLPAGAAHRHEVRVEADGAAPRTVEVAGLSPGEERPLRIDLVPGATLRVRPVGPDGGAVVGARAAWALAEPRSIDAASGGDLVESAPGLLAGVVPAVPLVVRVRAPARSSLADEVVRADPQRGEVLDLPVRLDRGGDLRLLFVDPAGAAVPGVVVSVDREAAPGAVPSDAAGRVTVGNLAATTVEVFYRAPRHDARSIEVEVSAGVGVERTVVVAPPPRCVEGIVVGPDRLPVAGAEVLARAALPGGERTVAAVTEPDGRFRIDLEGEAAGRASLEVRSAGVVRSLEVDVPAFDLEIALGDPSPWRLRLEPPPGGTAPDDVVVVAVRFVEGDGRAEGPAAIRSIETVRLVPAGEPGVFRSAGAVAPPALAIVHARGHAPEVLRAGAAPIPTLSLRPGGTIDCAVFDASGAPAPDALVVAIPAIGDGLELLLADAYFLERAERNPERDGRFVVRDVAPETLVIARGAAGEARALARVAPGGAGRLRLVLERRPR